MESVTCSRRMAVVYVCHQRSPAKGLERAPHVVLRLFSFPRFRGNWMSMEVVGAEFGVRTPTLSRCPTILPRVFTRQGVPVLGLPHWQVLRDRFPLCFRECVDVFVGPGLSTGYWPNATALRRCYRRAHLSEPVRVSIHAAHDHIMFKELPRRYGKDRSDVHTILQNVSEGPLSLATPPFWERSAWRRI